MHMLSMNFYNTAMCPILQMKKQRLSKACSWPPGLEFEPWCAWLHHTVLQQGSGSPCHRWGMSLRDAIKPKLVLAAHGAFFDHQFPQPAPHSESKETPEPEEKGVQAGHLHPSSNRPHHKREENIYDKGR